MRVDDLGIYFTNVIENSDDGCDELANFCLAPFHALLETATGPKAVQHITIDLDLDTVEETDLPEEELTALRIAQLALYVLVAIPATIIGLCLKVMAVYCNSGLDRQYTLLNLHFHCSKDVEQLIPQMTKQIFLTHVMPYLRHEDIYALECVNKDFWSQMRLKVDQKLLDVYQNRFQIARPLIPAFHTAARMIQNEIKREFRVYGTTGKITDFFDDYYDILQFPVVNLDEKTDIFKAVDNYSLTEEFKKQADIFRVPKHKELDYWTWGEPSRAHSAIVIKYSIFCSKELGDRMAEDQGKPKIIEREDYVECGYLILYSISNKFVIDVLRHEDGPFLDSTDFKKLINGKLLIKVDILLKSGNIIPLALGHKSVSDFYSHSLQI